MSDGNRTVTVVANWRDTYNEQNNIKGAFVNGRHSDTLLRVRGFLARGYTLVIHDHVQKDLPELYAALEEMKCLK